MHHAVTDILAQLYMKEMTGCRQTATKPALTGKELFSMSHPFQQHKGEHAPGHHQASAFWAGQQLKHSSS